MDEQIGDKYEIYGEYPEDPAHEKLRLVCEQVAKARSALTEMVTALGFIEVQTKFLLENFTDMMKPILITNRPAGVAPLKAVRIHSNNCVDCGRPAAYFTQVGAPYCERHKIMGEAIDREDRSVKFAMGFDPSKGNGIIE